jgi:hypothetical protein
VFSIVTGSRSLVMLHLPEKALPFGAYGRHGRRHDRRMTRGGNTELTKGRRRRSPSLSVAGARRPGGGRGGKLQVGAAASSSNRPHCAVAEIGRLGGDSLRWRFAAVDVRAEDMPRHAAGILELQHPTRGRRLLLFQALPDCALGYSNEPTGRTLPASCVNRVGKGF